MRTRVPGVRIANMQAPARAILSACLWVLLAGSHGHATAQVSGELGTPELLSAISTVRTKGCGGAPGTPVRLRPLPALDDTARRMALGNPSEQAAKAAGYRAVRLLTINLSGPSSTAAVANELASRYCERILDPLLTDFGNHRQGNNWWLAFAAPFSPPPESAAGEVAESVLALVNQTRSQSRSCGGHRFDAAAPLKAHPLLSQAAAAHAHDMAAHGYLDHTGRDGSSAADRATRAGYRWRAVGENIASGQTTPEQVMREWIASPDHCSNLMDAGFTDMGVAYAVNIDSPQGIYWAQAFGRPK